MSMTLVQRYKPFNCIFNTPDHFCSLFIWIENTPNCFNIRFDMEQVTHAWVQDTALDLLVLEGWVAQLLVRNQFICNCMELAFGKVFKTTLKKIIYSLKIMDLLLHFHKLLSRQLSDNLIMMRYYFMFCISIFSTNVSNDCLL